MLKYAAKVADVEALIRRRHGDAAAKKVGQDLEIMQGDHVRFVSSQRQKYGRGESQRRICWSRSGVALTFGRRRSELS